jgi:DHA1 family bicyclomycin/chloramphenicol resistance-like MFS transporter
MIGGGAALAALAGLILTETTGHYRLLEVMAVSSALSVLSILLVIRRTRRLGR